MKYLPSILGVVLGLGLVGYALHVTKEASCLWAMGYDTSYLAFLRFVPDTKDNQK